MVFCLLFIGNFSNYFRAEWVKDTHRENILCNKTEALAKGLNMYIWAIGVLSQLFIRDSYIQVKFSKK